MSKLFVERRPDGNYAAERSGAEKASSIAAHNFTNCIFSDGASWRLPTAFYHSTNLIDDVVAVTKAVKKCADSTGYKSEILVVKVANWSAFLYSKC